MKLGILLLIGMCSGKVTLVDRNMWEFHVCIKNCLVQNFLDNILRFRTLKLKLMWGQ